MRSRKCRENKIYKQFVTKKRFPNLLFSDNCSFVFVQLLSLIYTSRDCLPSAKLDFSYCYW